jgi:two-component sensor histidine kinase
MEIFERIFESTPDALLVVGDDGIIHRADQQAPRLPESLREKDLLLQEIHHRVKNNLAVISSLFFLEAARTEDPSTLALLTESQDRVRSMSLVHERLYRSGELHAVDFAGYASELCDELARGYQRADRGIAVRKQLSPLPLNVDTAVPTGLILNELITNALKHAFPDGRAGVVELRVARLAPDRGLVEVVDDGVGVPDGLAPAAASLGLRLITSLVRQIDGRFSLEAGAPGTRARVEIPLGVAA